MARINAKLECCRKEMDAIAGPGHNPISPQPIPNNKDPTTSLESISVKVGQENVSANHGFLLCLTKEKKGALTAMAPIITNARDGSQLLVIFKKLITFSGLVMPEIVNPKPKTKPETKEQKRFILHQSFHINREDRSKHK